jgi:general secretion pathway protein G
LVDRGYLREIPEDPMTSNNQWEEIYEDYDPEEPEAELGIWDVRSYSTGTSTNGEPYSDW